jgi:hypothetical protein
LLCRARLEMIGQDGFTRADILTAAEYGIELILLELFKLAEIGSVTVRAITRRRKREAGLDKRFNPKMSERGSPSVKNTFPGKT